MKNNFILLAALAALSCQPLFGSDDLDRLKGLPEKTPVPHEANPVLEPALFAEQEKLRRAEMERTQLEIAKQQLLQEQARTQLAQQQAQQPAPQAQQPPILNDPKDSEWMAASVGKFDLQKCGITVQMLNMLTAGKPETNQALSEILARVSLNAQLEARKWASKQFNPIIAEHEKQMEEQQAHIDRLSKEVAALRR